MKRRGFKYLLIYALVNLLLLNSTCISLHAEEVDSEVGNKQLATENDNADDNVDDDDVLDVSDSDNTESNSQQDNNDNMSPEDIVDNIDQQEDVVFDDNINSDLGEEYLISFYALSIVEDDEVEESYLDYVLLCELETENGKITDLPECPAVEGATFLSWKLIIDDEELNIPETFTADSEIYAIYEYEYEYEGLSTYNLVSSVMPLANEYGSAELNTDTGELLVLDWGVRTVDNLTTDEVKRSTFYAWYPYKDKVKSLKFANSVDRVNCSAFLGYFNLTTVDFNNVKVLKYASFRESGLQGQLDLRNVTEIHGASFQDCVGLTGSLDLSNVTIIGKKAFKSCENLDGTLTFSNTITKLESEIFNNCYNLSGTLNLKNIKTVGTKCFEDCYNFTGDLNLSNVVDICDYAFGYCDGFDGQLILSNNPTEIGYAAFCECYNLTGCVDLSNVTFIDEYAFYNVTGVNELILPDNVTTIYEGTFFGLGYDTDALFELDLKNIEMVEDGAFRYVNAKSINATKLHTIGYFSFGDMTNLEEIHLADTINSLAPNSFVISEDVASEVTKPLKVYTTDPSLVNGYFEVQGRTTEWEELESATLEYNGSSLIPDEEINSNDFVLKIVAKKYFIGHYESPETITYDIADYLNGTYPENYSFVESLNDDRMTSDNDNQEVEVKFNYSKPLASSKNYEKSVKVNVLKTSRQEVSRELLELNVEYIGPDIIEGYEVDKSDLRVKGKYKVQYNYGDSADIIIDIPIVDCEAVLPITVAGSNSITVKYSDKTAECTYNGLVNHEVSRELVSIIAEYTGADVELDNMISSNDFIISANYHITFQDNTTSEVTVRVNVDDCSFSDLSATMIGLKDVTITYTENGITKSDICQIMVTAREQPSYNPVFFRVN